MAQTPESKVKTRVKLILGDIQKKGYPVYRVMPMGTGFGSQGVPDFVVCVQGLFIGIECKSGKGKVTALQQMNLDNIKLAGGLALVINEENLSELEEVIMSWINTVRTEMLTASLEN